MADLLIGGFSVVHNSLPDATAGEGRRIPLLFLYPVKCGGRPNLHHWMMSIYILFIEKWLSVGLMIKSVTTVTDLHGRQYVRF